MFISRIKLRPMYQSVKSLQSVAVFGFFRPTGWSLTIRLNKCLGTFETQQWRLLRIICKGICFQYIAVSLDFGGGIGL
jgi:hypothetical protein